MLKLVSSIYVILNLCIMTGESNLATLIRTMRPKLNEGDYVFCTLRDLREVDINRVVSLFREEEGYTVILEKSLADSLNLEYTFVSAWITLTVHSSLEAVGLTAAFSNALSGNGISCNVVAAFYHDHIFVNRKDAAKAMEVLIHLSS